MEEDGGDAETGAEDLGRDLGMNGGGKRAEEHCHSTSPGLITTAGHTRPARKPLTRSSPAHLGIFAGLGL